MVEFAIAREIDNMCFFSWEQKVNNSGEFSPNYRRFSRTRDILFPLKKHILYSHRSLFSANTKPIPTKRVLPVRDHPYTFLRKLHRRLKLVNFLVKLEFKSFFLYSAQIKTSNSFSYFFVEKLVIEVYLIWKKEEE